MCWFLLFLLLFLSIYSTLIACLMFLYYFNNTTSHISCILFIALISFSVIPDRHQRSPKNQVNIPIFVNIYSQIQLVGFNSKDIFSQMTWTIGSITTPETKKKLPLLLWSLISRQKSVDIPISYSQTMSFSLYRFALCSFYILILFSSCLSHSHLTKFPKNSNQNSQPRARHPVNGRGKWKRERGVVLVYISTVRTRDWRNSVLHWHRSSQPEAFSGCRPPFTRAPALSTFATFLTTTKRATWSSDPGPMMVLSWMSYFIKISR